MFIATKILTLFFFKWCEISLMETKLKLFTFDSFSQSICLNSQSKKSFLPIFMQFTESPVQNDTATIKNNQKRKCDE